ncbi:MAG: hypothetical protein OK436_01610 [Thaumarchaeota archaeon]|nr:hypothetical protein [Nitrososphaerota archaeon]
MNNRKKLLPGLLVAIGLLTLSPLIAVADYSDGFDQYLSGTKSPWSAGNAWTLTYDNNAYAKCFTGTGVLNSGIALTPPNVYQFAANTANATCYGTGDHYARLSLSINATQAPLNWTWKQDPAVTQGSGKVNWIGSFCGTTEFNVDQNGMSAGFNKATYTTVATVPCILYWEIQMPTIGSTGAGTAKVFVDNFFTKGANAIFSNANLFMVDSVLKYNGKPAWYNISNYGKSYAELDFATGPPLTYSNLTAPDIHVNYGAATLLKVWVVPASYYVQVIPNDSTSNTVWLFNPSIVDTFTISIQDLSNQFGPGSTLTISQGSRVLSSGYTDAQNSYPLWIVPGAYQMVLTNGANTYSQQINFPSVNGASIPVQILKYQQGGNCGQICAVSYNAGFDAGGSNIVITYTDTTGTTTSVNDQIWVNGPLGASQFYTHTWTTGPYGTLTDTVGCNVNACNSTLASNIYVVLVFSDQYGQNTEHIPVSGGSTFFSIPNLPGGILSWNVVFPTAPSPLNFAAYIIVLLSAAGMGAQAAKFGVVVIPAEVAVLAGAGWLPLQNGASLFLIAIGVLAFIGWLEQGR